MKTQIAICKQSINSENFVAPKGVRPDNKPEAGGFWTSSLTESGKSGWLEFAEKEEFYSDEQKKNLQVCHIEIAKTARVLLIDTAKDFDQVIEKYGFEQQERNFFQGVYYERRLNYEKLMKDYDALSVTKRALHENFLELYGWDCESTVWFNLNHFESIKVAEFI